MRRRGFTLIELLVVISIIGILSTIGLSIYSGVKNRAGDVKKKKDIDAVATAYELNYNRAKGLYQPLEAQDYTGSSDYYCLLTQEAPAFKICAVLSDSTEYCRSSSRAGLSDCDTGVVQ